MFQQLVVQYQGLVYSLALSYCRDPHAAEDLAQEVFMQAFRSLDAIRDPAKIKTWLCTVTRNKAIDYLRRRVPTTPIDELPLQAPEPREDLWPQVEALLDELREDYRQLILLKYIEGLSYEQIGRILGMTPSAVGEKLHRVRKMMVKLLKERRV